MYHLTTKVIDIDDGGSQRTAKAVTGFSIAVNVDRDPLAPAETDDYIFIVDEDLPVAFDIFAANFTRYEIAGSVPVLMPGESLDGRVLDPLDIDDSIPMALARANTSLLFQNL
jgi:hypothetical protein